VEGYKEDRMVKALRFVTYPLHLLLYKLFIGDFRKQLFGEHYSRINTDQKIVALTFDDGPLSPYTESLLTVLEHHDVKATFFCLGQNLERHFDLAKRILAEKHEIGNHSYSHPRLYYRSSKFVRSEIDRTDFIIRSLGVTDQIHFRAPYGCSFLVLPWVLKQQKRPHILFDFFPNPTDWSSCQPEEVAESVIRQTRPGSIIVLHDGNPMAGEKVAKVSEIVVSRLKKEGYTFATVSQLLRVKEKGSNVAKKV
jgi:peptidoglycan/xylan/chitin deacetylase (PgdA/CDA1 family)